MLNLNSVVGVIELQEDCNCRSIIGNNQINEERVLQRLKFIVNLIKLTFSYNYAIVDKCIEVINIINFYRIGGLFCATLYGVILLLINIAWGIRLTSEILYFIIGTIAQNLHVIYDILC
jgi:hypothetical protein